MGRVKPRVSKPDREDDIRQAKRDFLTGVEPSIRSAAATYGLPYSTLRDRLRGAQNTSKAHEPDQLLTAMDEKAIVRFCKRLDDLGHPITMRILKGFASSLLPGEKRREVGKHWITRFLNRNPELSAKFSQRLDRQRANANDPLILKDYFRKVPPLLNASSGIPTNFYISWGN
jgi:hypothetical protein